MIQWKITRHVMKKRESGVRRSCTENRITHIVLLYQDVRGCEELSVLVDSILMVGLTFEDVETFQNLAYMHVYISSQVD